MLGAEPQPEKQFWHIWSPEKSSGGKDLSSFCAHNWFAGTPKKSLVHPLCVVMNSLMPVSVQCTKHHVLQIAGAASAILITQLSLSVSLFVIMRSDAESSR